jgi:hypothetical protein
MNGTFGGTDGYKMVDRAIFLVLVFRWRGHVKRQTVKSGPRASTIDSSQLAIRQYNSANSYVEERKERRETRAGASLVAGCCTRNEKLKPACSLMLALGQAADIKCKPL